MKLQVEYMSFSAHADAKGIMQLIRMAEPRNMLLVHGEAVKMEFLKGKIEQEFSECSNLSHHFKPPVFFKHVCIRRKEISTLLCFNWQA